MRTVLTAMDNVISSVCLRRAPLAASLNLSSEHLSTTQ
jgi:hypothetical protein